MALPKSIINLSDSFSSLPSIGSKLSNKLALYLTITNKSLAKKLYEDISTALEKVKTCKRCFNVTESEFCEICQDSSRNQKRIIIVENSIDLYTLESAGYYDGLYHVLLGVISPINGIGPDELTIDNLVDRVKTEKISEIIFGLNPTLEGDSTSEYIKSLILEVEGLSISRLAKGIPAGTNIEYVSPQTLIESFKKRDQF